MIEPHRFNYATFENINSITESIIAKVVDFQDKAIKQAMLEYCEEYARENKINLEVSLIDKKMVEEIFDLGLESYKMQQTANDVRKWMKGEKEQ